jgi:hypothetical protein
MKCREPGARGYAKNPRDYIRAKPGTPEGWAAGMGGRKIRSRGMGRGLGIGRGRGPIGIPIGEKRRKNAL